MQELSFDLGHIKLAGLGLGDPGKPMILATHGWLDNAASFLPLSAYLDDYYIVAIDFAGHGKSQQRSKGAQYHILENIYDLHVLIEQQNWPPFILLGHSMGGILGMVYASSFPEKVSKLIMLDAFAPLIKKAELAPQQLRDAVFHRLEHQTKPVKHPESIKIAVNSRLSVTKMAAQNAELLMRRNIKSVASGYEWTTDPRLKTLSLMRMTEEQADSFFSEVKCPVMCLLGDEGYPEIRQYLLEKHHLVQNFQWHDIPGFHHFHMDNPVPAADKIKDFLTTV